MALSDSQIERYSRQIVLPQVGGIGQERLLRSSVSVAGDGELAAVVALYLAGAGVGRIALHRADGGRLAGELVDLNPDTVVSTEARASADTASDVLVACDLPLPELDSAVSLGRPLIAGGADGWRGWLVVAESSRSCAACAARAAAAQRPQSAEVPCAVTSATAGAVGSLLALAALKRCLRLETPGQPVWLQFDAARSTLTEQPLSSAADCPVCVAEEPDDSVG